MRKDPYVTQAFADACADAFEEATSAICQMVEIGSAVFDIRLSQSEKLLAVVAVIVEDDINNFLPCDDGENGPNGAADRYEYNPEWLKCLSDLSGVPLADVKPAIGRVANAVGVDTYALTRNP